MKTTIRLIARALFRAGGPGLLALGIVDSSPLVVPLGNDLLMLALSARHHDRAVYYVFMATLGSVIGCLATDWLSRKGRAELKKFVSARYLDSISRRVEKSAGGTVFFASLMPPPFPFTAVVAAAAAFRYPRGKLLGFVGAGRLIRFAIEAALAVHYGRWIIRQAESPTLYRIMLVLIVISIAGSVLSVMRWRQKPETRPA